MDCVGDFFSPGKPIAGTPTVEVIRDEDEESFSPTVVARADAAGVFSFMLPEGVERYAVRISSGSDVKVPSRTLVSPESATRIVPVDASSTSTPGAINSRLGSGKQPGCRSRRGSRNARARSWRIRTRLPTHRRGRRSPGCGRRRPLIPAGTGSRRWTSAWGRVVPSPGPHRSRKRGLGPALRGGRSPL